MYEVFKNAIIYLKEPFNEPCSILKQMKCENTTLPSPRAALKDLPKGSRNGSQNDARKRPRTGLSGETSTPKTLCFPYVSARNGQWQGPQRGPQKGPRKISKKGARNEARKGAEAGIELKIIIVLKI